MTDDVYYGLGEAELIEAEHGSESSILAGWDDTGYFSIVSVEVFEVEGERHIEIQDERQPFVNLTRRQAKEVARRMDGDA